MMMSLAPMLAPADITNVREILELISDQAACAERLAELAAATDTANKAVADAAKAQADLKAQIAEHEKVLQRVADLNAAQADLAAREAALSVREQAFADAKAAVRAAIEAAQA